MGDNPGLALVDQPAFAGTVFNKIMHKQIAILPLRPVTANPPFNLYLLGCTLVAALGGLLFGFDTAVISGTTDALRARFVLTDGLLGFTVASALIGTIVGSIGYIIGLAGAAYAFYAKVEGPLLLVSLLVFISMNTPTHGPRSMALLWGSTASRGVEKPRCFRVNMTGP